MAHVRFAASAAAAASSSEAARCRVERKHTACTWRESAWEGRSERFFSSLVRFRWGDANDARKRRRRRRRDRAMTIRPDDDDGDATPPRNEKKPHLSRCFPAACRDQKLAWSVVRSTKTSGAPR